MRGVHGSLLPGFNREEIKVSVEPRRLSISGKTSLAKTTNQENIPIRSGKTN
jgi:HSP20 family molecular chaperone IbpA